MRSPGFMEHPEHKVDTERMSQTVEIFLEGDRILETQGAIRVKETEDQERIYVPINDLTNIDLIKISDYHCPFKGDAEIYDVIHGARVFENAAWSFVNPYDEVSELKGRVAFYPEKIQEIRVN